jgi:hypothetical protein
LDVDKDIIHEDRLRKLGTGIDGRGSLNDLDRGDEEDNTEDTIRVEEQSSSKGAMTKQHKGGAKKLASRRKDSVEELKDSDDSFELLET